MMNNTRKFACYLQYSEFSLFQTSRHPIAVLGHVIEVSISKSLVSVLSNTHVITTESNHHACSSTDVETPFKN